MGTYTGLFIDETITPTFISPTVTADPAGSIAWRRRGYDRRR